MIALAPGAGCYYARVGIGQARVLLGRESIESALESDELDPSEKARLAIVPKVRTFAHVKLGLVENGSYTKFYDTGRKPISWNVTACARTSFTPYLWSFPFVGSAPYKGFFDLDDAGSEATDLKAAGYDVTVREVGAYSTLGWFDDPVFRRMLDSDVHDLANTIIHELTHATVFRPGDASFNESLATFVGNEGALAFLAAEYGASSREIAAARDAAADGEVFSAFIDDLYAKLDRLYGSSATQAEKLARRERIFAAAKTDFEAIRKTRMRAPDAYAGIAKRPLNNAVILGYRRYHVDLGLYADVLRACGGDWGAALGVFREAAESEAPRDYLVAWRKKTGAATRSPASRGTSGKHAPT